MHNASTGSPSPLGHCWGSIDLLSRFFKYWPGQENSSKVVEPCHSQNLSTLKHGHGYCFFCHRVLQPKSGGAISCTKQVWAANKVKKRTSQNHGRITDHICMFSQVWYLLNHAAHWRLTHSRLWKAVRCTLALRLFSVPVKPAQGHRNCLYFGHMTSLLNLTSLTWCTAGCWTQNGFIIFHNTMGKKNILSIVVYSEYTYPIRQSTYPSTLICFRSAMPPDLPANILRLHPSRLDPRLRVKERQSHGNATHPGHRTPEHGENTVVHPNHGKWR